MILENKIPCKGVEIIFLVGELNFKIVAQNVGHFVKSFEAAIVVDYSFGTTEVGA